MSTPRERREAEASDLDALVSEFAQNVMLQTEATWRGDAKTGVLASSNTRVTVAQLGVRQRAEIHLHCYGDHFSGTSTVTR